MAVDPRQLLGLDGLLSQVGGAPRDAPVPRRILFHQTAAMGIFDRSGFPAGVEITNTATGEPIDDLYVASIDVTDEDGQPVKHLIWFDDGGIANLLDKAVGLLSEDVLSKLEKRVVEERVIRSEPELETGS